jgi:hypothetical protein
MRTELLGSALPTLITLTGEGMSGTMEDFWNKIKGTSISVSQPGGSTFSVGPTPPLNLLPAQSSPGMTTLDRVMNFIGQDPLTAAGIGILIYFILRKK